jgi:hypothetical protein
MPSTEYDLRYLQSGIEDLETYLLSNDLYWTVHSAPPHGEPPYPQLTPGGLLLAWQRLQGNDHPIEMQMRLARLHASLESLLMKWRSAWERKCAQDFRARLNLWTNYLTDYRERPAAHYDRYGYEVQRRVQLSLLHREARDIPAAELDSLNGLDGLLKAVFVPGPFVWEPATQKAFPQSTYWYLYGGLRKDLPDNA